MRRHARLGIAFVLITLWFQAWVIIFCAGYTVEVGEKYVQSSHELQAALGGDLRIGRYPRGSARLRDGRAELRLRAIGNDGSARVDLSLRRAAQAEDWRVVSAQLMTDAGPLKLATRDSTNLRAASVSTAQGFALYQRGLHAEALAALDEALVADARHGEAHYWRGYVLEEMGDVQGARAAFQAAVALQPSNHLAHYALGVAYGRQGEYARALQSLDRAIELDPAYGRAYLSRAVTRGRLGDEAGAISDLGVSCELGYADACAARARYAP